MSDTVSVNVRWTFVDGEDFGKTERRKSPVVTTVRGFIDGWGEALKQMKENSKLQLFLPTDLAYGVRGANPIVGPSKTLIYELELLEIVSKEAEEGHDHVNHSKRHEVSP